MRSEIIPLISFSLIGLFFYIHFRQLDTNILLILAEKLNVAEHPLPLECVGEAMGLPEFRFVLTDVVQKIESVVGIRKCQTDEPLQYIAKPEYFMCDMGNFIKYIDRNMKAVSCSCVFFRDALFIRFSCEN